MGSSKTPGLFFSPRPGKGYTEKLYTFYTAIWVPALAVVILGGYYRTYEDFGFMVLGISAMLPLWIWPLVFPPECDKGKLFWEHTSFRVNCFIFILSFIGNYLMTEYFFELLGMRYHWWNKWNFDSPIIGTQKAPVPFWLTPLTHAYFATYHGFASVIWRFLRGRFRLGAFGNAVVVLALAYAFAFAETFFMAADIIADVFEYRDRSWMLLYGSCFYAVLFVASFPVFARLDETHEEENRSLADVVLRAMGCNMFAILVLDMYAFFGGPVPS